MIIAWFSAGITSAVACKLALMQYPEDDIKIFYFEIASAHPDNPRFIADCEKWFNHKIEIVKQDKYQDQFDVIKKVRFINSPHGAACTSKLKKAHRERIEKNYPGARQVFGFEFEQKEINRAVRFKQQHPHTNPLYPLIDSQLTKNQCADILLKNGIALPPMYEMGYSNNNCIGCVKGGQGYWNKIRVDFPERFLQMASLEQEIGRSCLKQEMPNGKSGPLFLNDLDPEAGRDEKIVLPNCGTFCEIEFADLIDPETEQILNSPLQKNIQLSFI